MMKDEIDVAVHTIRHMASEQLDGIIVADNLSDDGTLEALRGLESELASAYPSLAYEVIIDPVRAYLQSQKMTALAARAAEKGATWIVPFDADELWYAERPVGEVLRGLGDHCHVALAELRNYFPCKSDIPGAIPFQRITHRLPYPGVLPKVAFRWQPDAVIEQGNHGVALPGVDLLGGGQQLLLRIAHYPARAFEQFVSKVRNGAAAYALTDLPPETGAHWRQYGDMLRQGGEEGLRIVYDEWFDFPDDTGLLCEPAPFRRWSTN